MGLIISPDRGDRGLNGAYKITTRSVMVTSTTVVSSNYLPVDALHLIQAIAWGHPILSGIGLLAGLAVVYGLLQHQLGRRGGDIFAAAVFLLLVLVFVTACLYLLCVHPGYRVVHPGF